MTFGSFLCILKGSSKLSSVVRAVDDHLNSCFGCGLSSAIVRFKDGPQAMASSFVTGFVLVYVINEVCISISDITIIVSCCHQYEIFHHCLMS